MFFLEPQRTPQMGCHAYLARNSSALGSPMCIVQQANASTIAAASAEGLTATHGLQQESSKPLHSPLSLHLARQQAGSGLHVSAHLSVQRAHDVQLILRHQRHDIQQPCPVLSPAHQE